MVIQILTRPRVVKKYIVSAAFAAALSNSGGFQVLQIDEALGGRERRRYHAACAMIAIISRIPLTLSSACLGTIPLSPSSR
jgi:hypothetical protein